MTNPERPSYRFDASKRIKRENDFRRVYQFRARIFNSLLAVCCRPSAPDQPSRLGISVSKKIVRRAVLRNRWKRLIREAFRLQYHDLPQGYDFIVIPQRQDPFPEYAEVAKSLRELTRRAARKANKIMEIDSESNVCSREKANDKSVNEQNKNRDS